MGIRVKKLLLFGSHARGTAGADSDIDLAVVSDDFTSMDLWERMCLLGRARVGIARPMEILGFTQQEFAERHDGTFVGDEVRQKGVEIE